MDAIKTIHDRQSVRKYKSDPVPDDVLNTVLEAGRAAPSWANVQATFVIVVKDPAKKQALSDALSPKNPATKAVQNAPIILAVGCKTNESGFYKGKALTVHGDYGMFDAGLVAANISLAARDQGLGSVHVAAMDIEKASGILDIPEEHHLLELIPIGYPDHEPKRVPRKPMDQFASNETFGGK